MLAHPVVAVCLVSLLNSGRYREPEERQGMWGERFGPASRPGYNPHTSYMGFNGKKGNEHWYEDTAEAAKAEDRSRMYRSWTGFLIFAVGLSTVFYTNRVRSVQARPPCGMHAAVRVARAHARPL